MKTLTHIHHAVHVATIPIHVIVCRIPSARRQRAVKLGAGAVIMLVGVVISKNPYHLLHHIVADVIGYGLHGYGSLPFIKILCAHFDLEDVDSKRKEKTSVPQVNMDNVMRDRAWRNM